MINTFVRNLYNRDIWKHVSSSQLVDLQAAFNSAIKIQRKLKRFKGYEYISDEEDDDKIVNVLDLNKDGTAKSEKLKKLTKVIHKNTDPSHSPHMKSLSGKQDEKKDKRKSNLRHPLMVTLSIKTNKLMLFKQQRKDFMEKVKMKGQKLPYRKKHQCAQMTPPR